MLSKRLVAVLHGKRVMKAHFSAPSLTGNPNLVNIKIFDTPPADPIALLNDWIDNAIKLKVSEPLSFVLATAGKDGIPSTRVLLAKLVDANKGIVFGTGEASAKGKEFSENPKASINFWWRETMQQINIQGTVVKLSSSESDDVFNDRIKTAQAIAVVAEQSTPMANEAQLRQDISKYIDSHKTITRPAHWHGYALKIEGIEFWVGGVDRFHLRLRYDLVNGKWVHKRLQP